MKKISILFFSLIPLVACGRPDSVQIVKSPINGLFYTVELSKTAGPVSDTTRVFAHFERGGKSRKILVLDGSDITIPRIVWNGSREVTLCMTSGITSIFLNQETLIVGDTPEDSITVHNTLDEHCDDVSTMTPDAGN